MRVDIAFTDGDDKTFKDPKFQGPNLNMPGFYSIRDSDGDEFHYNCDSIKEIQVLHSDE